MAKRKKKAAFAGLSPKAKKTLKYVGLGALAYFGANAIMLKRQTPSASFREIVAETFIWPGVFWGPMAVRRALSNGFK
jgi:hypothetical protein